MNGRPELHLNFEGRRGREVKVKTRLRRGAGEEEVGSVHRTVEKWRADCTRIMAGLTAECQSVKQLKW